MNDNLIYIENIVQDEQENLKAVESTEQKLIRDVIEKCLKSENVDVPVNINVYICDNEYIRSLNKEYRDIDRATDVLSFPMTESLEGKLIYGPGDFEDGRLVLGEIVLSSERASEQAAEYGHSVEREIGYLISHGVFHLLGFDHENTDEAEIMFARQESVMEALGLRREK